MSAHSLADVALVRQRIIDLFEDSYHEAQLLVPYARQALVSEMHEAGQVLEEKYEEDGIHVRFRSDEDTIARIGSKLLE